MQPVTPESVAAEQSVSNPGTAINAGAPCRCGSTMHPVEQYLYAIGHLDVRFPSLAIEREYQQRERAIPDLPQHPRNARLLAVLQKNPHLSMRVSYILLIGGTPVFALTPSSGFLKDAFFKALEHSHEAEHFCAVIGRVGGFTDPASYGGLLLTLVAVDQLYPFAASEWVKGLKEVAKPALQSRKIEASGFQTVSLGIFREVMNMPDNIGMTDGHRALNYLLLQHPGMFLAAAERSGHLLDRIETRVMQGVGGRRHVAVILSFLDRATNVPERVYCTVDITEEWPFVVAPDGLGFAPYVDTFMYAAG